MGHPLLTIERSLATKAVPAHIEFPGSIFVPSSDLVLLFDECKGMTYTRLLRQHGLSNANGHCSKSIRGAPTSWINGQINCNVVASVERLYKRKSNRTISATSMCSEVGRTRHKSQGERRKLKALEEHVLLQ